MCVCPNGCVCLLIAVYKSCLPHNCIGMRPLLQVPWEMNSVVVGFLEMKESNLRNQLQIKVV